MFWKRILLGAALVAGAALPVASQEHHAAAHDHNAPRAAGAMPLLGGLGTWQHIITAKSATVQAYFDQGLALIYGFNHDEALRSFEEAARIDPACAMCQWGIAYAVAPNINLPIDSAREARGLAAVREAQRLATRVTRRERDYINALAVRFGEPAGTSRAARDSAFATEARKVAQRYRSDVDAQVIFADAMLNLRPWNQWTRDGKAQPGTVEAVNALELAMQLNPNHAGACHLYVHAVEASPTPQRALPCAERLPRLMPGAGHIVHMPAHIYLRVGRYEDAARANIAAVEADQRYFSTRDVAPGVYPMFYAPHNLHFLWSAYLLSGQRAKALGAARALLERVSIDDAAAIPSLQSLLTSTILTLVRFGDWDAVLTEPAPRADLRYAKAIWHYSQGMARVARNELSAANVQLDSVRAIAAEVPADMIIILNSAQSLLELATDVLSSQIARKERRYDVAITELQSAVRREDALTYDEPPPWYHSARNLLGHALLEAGRLDEAGAAFRDDLRFLPENGWSLAGLQQVLKQQDRQRAASSMGERFARAWRYADAPAVAGR